MNPLPRPVCVFGTGPILCLTASSCSLEDEEERNEPWGLEGSPTAGRWGGVSCEFD